MWLLLFSVDEKTIFTRVSGNILQLAKREYLR